VVEVSDVVVFRTASVARRWMAAGAVGLVLTALGGFFRPDQALASYLAAFAYWVAVAVGALVFLMMGYAARAKWPVAMRRITEGAVGAFPALALLALPVLLGVRHLYVWLAPPAAIAGKIAGKHVYLNWPFFAARTAAYFAIWIETTAWSTAAKRLTAASAPSRRACCRSRGSPSRLRRSTG
jgi:hypothetical protein